MPIALTNEAILALIYHLIAAVIPISGAHAVALFLRDTGVNLRASRVVENIVPALLFVAFGFYIYLSYLYGWRFAVVSAVVFFAAKFVFYGALNSMLRSVKDVEKTAHRIVSAITFSSGLAIYFLILLTVHLRLISYEPFEKFNKLVAAKLGIPISAY